MNNSKLKQMANLSGPNSRNHTGPGSTQVQPYNSWFRDTLRSSNQKITMVNTPSRSYRGQALVSMETPSTVYTTPKQTPITARGSKANETM